MLFLYILSILIYFSIIFKGIEDKGYLCLLKQLVRNKLKTQAHISCSSSKTNCFNLSQPRVQPAASDVIAQAILRGVLSADGINEYSLVQPPKRKKKAKKRIFSQHDGIPMTFAAQQKVVHKKYGSLERSKPFLM